MRLLFYLLFPVFLAVSQAAGAQPLFEDEAILEASLTGPLNTLIKNKNEKTREELPFTFSAEGVSYDIQVRIRGNSRIELCSFPPLRLNFSGADTSGTLFADQNKLKLVTHCQKSRFSASNVLEEYAAYRIFTLMTPVGYRVRLLKIRYRDTDGRVSGLGGVQTAFLIEAKESLARRAGGMLALETGVYPSRLDLEQAGRLYVFQYLIGNTDWSLSVPTGEEFCCHNVTLIDIAARLTPVPYDFDMSGLVKARYARPHPDLRKISRVTQRLYRGFCMDSSHVRSALRQVMESREEITRLIKHLPGLTSSNVKRDLEFLERFFTEAEHEDRLVEKFEADCVG
jgi:hypothetical protein